MMTSRPRAGFSALELGLCFLMIAAGMLLIMYHRTEATGRARRVSCASNLKQLAHAHTMYAADHGGRGPVAQAPDALMPYVKNMQIFRCPGAELAPRHWDPYDFEERPAIPTDYQFCAGLWTDDPPWTLVAQDDAPDRHLRDTWVGARLDGAVRVFPAEKWKALE